MKRILFVVAIVLTSILTFFENTIPSNSNEGTDAIALSEWNLMRLADPSTGKIPDHIRELELAFASTLPVNYNRSAAWDLIGPRDLGGRTRAIDFDVRDDSILIAGSTTGGIWKSIDGGQSFYKVTLPAQLHSVTSIVQDKRSGHEDTWYAGTGEYYPVASQSAYSAPFSGNGVFKSTDNGETWTLLTSTASNTPHTGYTNGDMDYVWRLVTDHTNTTQDVVLAAVYNGIFRSDDGGSTWMPVLGVDTSTTSTSDFVDLIQTPSGIFYAVLSSDGPDKGVYRSDDGIVWTNILPATGWPSNYRRFVMTYNPQNENELMFLGETPAVGTNGHSLWKYTYLSGNGSGAGGQWENRSTNMPTFTCTGYFTFDFGKFSSQSSYDLAIAWHPTNDSVIFLGGTNIYRSTNQFTNGNTNAWIGGYRCNAADISDYVYPNHHPDQHGMKFYPNDPNRLLSFNDGGLYHSNNLLDSNVTWSSLNHHYVTGQFYTVAIEEGSANSDYLICGAQDNGTWFTNANHMDSLWKWIARGDGSYGVIPEGRPWYVTSIQLGKVYKAIVNHVGDTLLPTRIDPNKTNTGQFINPLLLDPNNNDRMYMLQGGKIVVHDSIGSIPLDGNKYDTLGTGWRSVVASTVSLSESGIACIEMCKSDPDVLYMGTGKGHIYKIINAPYSNASRTHISSPNFPTGAYMSNISVNQFNKDDILVTFANYKVQSIWHTTDGGNTWQAISGNLEENADGSGSGPAVYWAEIYPSWPTTYFVGTSVGLFSTTQPDSMNTIWTQEGANTIGNMNVNMIVSRPYDGKIAVATHGNGIYTAYLTPSYLGTGTPLPKEERFMDVLPNPSAGAARIRFNLDRSSDVKIEVYDLQGKRVYHEDLGQQMRGGHEILINQNGNFRSGVYLVTVFSNGTKTTRKWIVR